MSQFTVKLKVTIDTALSVGAGGTAGVLADKAVVRDQLGRLILPGSQVKGRLRHACEEITRGLGKTVCQSPRAETMCPQFDDSGLPEEKRIPRFNAKGEKVDSEDPTGRPKCIICQLFGSPAYPSSLYFGDLIYDPDPPMEEPTIRPGAAINRRLGVVSEKRLYFTETSPPGIAPTFASPEAINGSVPDERYAKLLLAGLELIQNWGGGKSRGLGWGEVGYEATLDGKRVEPKGLEVIKQL